MVAILAWPQPAAAQEHEVSGEVVAQEDGTALPGVNVSVKGTTIGTATDADGAYTLTAPSPTDTLEFSYVGYETQEVPIDERSVINVEMAASVVQTEELIVVGYGVQEEENLTGSVSAVSGADLEDRAVTSPVNALQGKVPGLTVIQRSGEPGDDSGIARIRGLGTFGNNNPLVLIDGIEGSLSDVSSRDIESVTVLKDAAAASIYGVRAANGVILVSTKEGGQEDGIGLQYRGYVGAQTATRLPNLLGSADYARLLNEANMNEGREPLFSQEEIAAFESGTDPDQYPNTDWLDELLNSPALQHEHHLSLSGREEGVDYRTSFGYRNRHGLVPSLGANEYRVRVNLGTDVSEKLHVALRLSGVQEEVDGPYSGSGSLFLGAIRTPPTIPVRYSDGTWGTDEARGNPVREAYDDGHNQERSRNLRASGTAEYEILEGLTLEGRGGVNMDSDLQESFQAEVTYYDFDTGEVSVVNGDPRQLAKYEGDTRDLTFETLLRFDQSFGSQNLGAVAGYSQRHFRSEWFNASIQDLPSNFVHELNAGDPSTERNNGSSSAWALRSSFGRVNYSFADRYLLEVNARYDGSSRFPEGQRYGFFPSFSIGWRISEEPFFDVGFISDLKLRGSWGMLGNDDVGLYAHWPTFSTSAQYTFGDRLVPGIVESRLPNENITWETATTTDVGIDLALFEGKLDLTADYFYKVTDDILLNLPIPASVGIGAPAQNAASVLNRGWEFAGEYQEQVGDLGFSLSGNLSFVHNEITDLADTGPYISNVGSPRIVGIQEEGLPLNSFYGYEAIGFFQSEEEVENHATQDPVTSPGDLKYKDQNGDGVINSEDRVYLGSYFPGITYSATITVNYKGVDFRTFLQGTGRVKGALTNEAAEAFFQDANAREWHKDRWTPDNQDASYPRLTLTTDQNRRFSSFWVQDASYLRVKSVQLGYTFSESSFLDRFGMSRLRVYANADNLFTFTGFRGYDPEAPLSRGAFYPNVTTYTFGIDLSI